MANNNVNANLTKPFRRMLAAVKTLNAMTEWVDVEWVIARVRADRVAMFHKRKPYPRHRGGDEMKIETTYEPDIAQANVCISELTHKLAAAQAREAELVKAISDVEFVVRGGDKDMALKILREALSGSRSSSIAEELKCLREEHEAGRTQERSSVEVSHEWRSAWQKAEAARKLEG